MSPFIVLDVLFIILPFAVLAFGFASKRLAAVTANVGSFALLAAYAGFSLCGMSALADAGGVAISGVVETGGLQANILTWNVNGFGILIREFLLLSFLFASLLSSGYFTHKTDGKAALIDKPEFLSAMLFVAVGGMLVVSAQEILSLFIGLELATIPMYFLVAWNKKDDAGAEAAIKYILMGSIATAVELFGFGYLYGFAGSMAFSEISSAVSNVAGGADFNLLLIAVFFIVMGIGFKLTLFPFYAWSPDVYEGAPTPITAYLSVTSKGVALAFLGILVYKPLAEMGVVFQLIFSILAMATIFVGNLGALKQTRLRRFMAYSSIAQAGYILVGLCGDARLGAPSFVYYLFLYAFSNYLLFFLIGIVGKDRPESFDSLRGLAKQQPVLAVLFAIGAFSLAGIPPLAGFIGKWMVFASAASVGNYALVAFASINSVIALYYYLQIIKAAWVEDEGSAIAALPPLSTTVGEKAALGALAFGTLFFGIAPFLHSYVYKLAW